MADMIKTGSILIKDGTFLPDAPGFESEPYARGWRFVKNLEAHGLSRRIDEAGWTFFCVAGDTRATILGYGGQKGIRRAVRRILTRLEFEKFNLLEITQVALKHFLGVPYVRISARSQRLQERMSISPAKDLQEPGVARQRNRETFSP